MSLPRPIFLALRTSCSTFSNQRRVMLQHDTTRFLSTTSSGEEKKALNVTQMVEVLAQEHGLTKAATTRIITSLFDSIKEVRSFSSEQ